LRCLDVSNGKTDGDRMILSFYLAKVVKRIFKQILHRIKDSLGPSNKH